MCADGRSICCPVKASHVEQRNPKASRGKELMMQLGQCQDALTEITMTFKEHNDTTFLFQLYGFVQSGFYKLSSNSQDIVWVLQISALAVILLCMV